MGLDVDQRHVGLGGFEPGGVVALVEAGGDAQAGVGRGGAEGVDHGLERVERHYDSAPSQ